ncbi:hypothetical protein PtrEW7m1_012129, partial [Pyrenophora tritici-repentis]
SSQLDLLVDISEWLPSDPEPAYKVKQKCLSLAMPPSSLNTIKVLLDHGATLICDSLQSATSREEPAIFQQLLDHG